MEHQELALSDKEFARIKARVYDLAGISLSDSKRTLVISRLSKIIRALGLETFEAYVERLERGASSADTQAFVNALTTNLTRFYREDHHFAHLSEHVGRLISSRPRGQRLRIWSAGCSTGQEAYTVALDLLANHPELKRWDFRILATDIDTAVLERAAEGRYPASELSGLSASRAGLFEKAADGSIVIPSAARQLIAFKPLNLMTDWPMKGPFDAIFCRNVAIYFDKPTQARLFARLGEMLAPDAFLYIGHSENVGSSSSGLRLVGKTIYQSRQGVNGQVAA
ncbi:chemotaxis protein methyltransferase [Devosia pacifica]|uniref:Chemotaxis protein methyltransferase n=1 Tax=Devosia pacifica TaxID=1335967 RepID=A0A918S7L8_9HYPH|nr:protein-glutamate O-methyltransferase CheR [Devosia pacifica]GHA25718.1 chemotaxis protein methyltransferase [Devosia pacifica]